MLLGATGLTGGHVLEFLLEDDAFEQVRVLVRQPLERQHPKLDIRVVNFNDHLAYRRELGTGDCIFCCIGTTLAQVKGNKQLYRTIDFDIPVNAARFGLEAGFRQYLLVSSHLANARSPFFYPRLKGETEEIICTFPFQSIHLFRPSFLVGKRKRTRYAESLGGKLMQLLNPLLPEVARPVQAAVVARAMVKAARQGQPGLHHYTYSGLQELGGNSR
ncbi:MAG TPA: NAD(P)H-binding protein [Lacibacter sp.]|nr:NAD(P)H-binding protein [Lacibacter sp.]